MPTHDKGRYQPPGDHTGPDIDALFAATREIVRRRTPPVDVDRVITVAAAALERRRAQRLAAVRIAGIALILGLLAAWLVGFSDWGTDVLYTIVMFTIPALVVFRWHLSAIDGGGLRPWRTPSTVAAWSQEATRRVEDLTSTIDRLDRLSARLGKAAVLVKDMPQRAAVPVADRSGEPTGVEQGLPVLTTKAHSGVEQVRTRLVGCRAGAEEFVATCRSTPGRANWRVLRDLDPAELVALLRPAAAKLGLAAGFADGLAGANAAVAGVLGEARHEVDELLRVLGPRCSTLIEACDTLHRLASQQRLEQAPQLGVVRRATSSAAVVVSGWRQPPAWRVATRNRLLDLDQVTGGGPFWGQVIRQARTAARKEVLAPVGGL